MASRAQLIQRNLNWARAYAAGCGDQQGQHDRADGDQQAGDEILALILDSRGVSGQAGVRREEGRRPECPRSAAARC